MFTPIARLNSTQGRWVPVPTPAEPNCAVFSLALSQAMNSCRFLTGRSLRTLTMRGDSETSPTGVKSVTEL